MRPSTRRSLSFIKQALKLKRMKLSAPGSAGMQAEEAVRRGCDTIIACGGDGTVHEVLQSLAGTQVALGVVPLGTANALAANLGLQSSPAKAVRKLLTAIPVRLPVGQISYQDAAGETRSRYFTVAAGVGADALFISRLDPALKRRFGYLLYMIEGFRVWATHTFPLFEAAFIEGASSQPRVEEISELLVVRIRNFGGALNNFIPGATLHNRRLRLVAFKTRSRLRYFCFLIAALFGRTRSTRAD